MGLHTSRHTRKTSSFSTQDEPLVLLGLEALTGVSNLHYATRSIYIPPRFWQQSSLVAEKPGPFMNGLGLLFFLACLFFLIIIYLVSYA
jgi:hypothetical protein